MYLIESKNKYWRKNKLQQEKRIYVKMIHKMKSDRGKINKQKETSELYLGHWGNPKHNIT